MLKILAAGLMISVLIVSVIMILQLAHAKGLKVYLTVNTNLASQGARIITYQFGSQVYSHDGFINNGITTFDLQYPDGLIENGNFRICVTALTSYLESCSDGYNGEAKRPERVTVSLFGSFTPQPQPQPSQGGQSQSQSQSITHLIIAIPNLTRWNPIKKLSITGSSSGVGLESALLLARNGYITYATMRSPEKDTSMKAAVQNEDLPIRVIQLDVTDENSVKNAVDQVISEAGRIDVLVNNAGYSLGGALEDLSMEEIKPQFETNLFGLIRVTQAVLPIMRKQRSGRILNISSGSGIFGFPGLSAYVSTKFAVEGLSESIAYELEPFGIKVILIEPGFIRTNFAHAMVIAKKVQDPASPYSELMQKIMASASELSKNASDAELVANIILDAASNPNPHLRYLAGKDVESWAAGKKNMDELEFFNMIKGLIT